MDQDKKDLIVIWFVYEMRGSLGDYFLMIMTKELWEYGSGVVQYTVHGLLAHVAGNYPTKILSWIIGGFTWSAKINLMRLRLPAAPFLSIMKSRSWR